MYRKKNYGVLFSLNFIYFFCLRLSTFTFDFVFFVIFIHLFSGFHLKFNKF